MTRESEKEIEEEPSDSLVDQLQENAPIWESVFQPAMDEALHVHLASQASFSGTQPVPEYPQCQAEPLDLSATSAANTTSLSTAAPMAEESQDIDHLTQTFVQREIYAAIPPFLFARPGKLQKYFYTWPGRENHTLSNWDIRSTEPFGRDLNYC